MGTLAGISCVSTRGGCQYSYSGKLWGFGELNLLYSSQLTVLPIGLSGASLEGSCCGTEGRRDPAVALRSGWPSSRLWVSPKRCQFCQRAVTHVCIRLANQGEAAKQWGRPKIRPSMLKWALSGVRGALHGPLALVSGTQLVGCNCGMPEKSGLWVGFSAFSFCSRIPWIS